jgi:hypothetical protein
MAGVKFLADVGIFFFNTTFRLALGHAQPPIQWLQGVMSLEMKQIESKVLNLEALKLYLCATMYTFMAWYF